MYPDRTVSAQRPSKSRAFNVADVIPGECAMATTVVYQFEVFNSASRAFERQASFRTPESITQRGGVLIPSTAQLVPAEEIDPHGVWRPLRNPLI